MKKKIFFILKVQINIFFILLLLTLTSVDKLAYAQQQDNSTNNPQQQDNSTNNPQQQDNSTNNRFISKLPSNQYKYWRIYGNKKNNGIPRNHKIAIIYYYFKDYPKGKPKKTINVRLAGILDINNKWSIWGTKVLSEKRIQNSLDVYVKKIRTRNLDSISFKEGMEIAFKTAEKDRLVAAALLEYNFVVAIYESHVKTDRASAYYWHRPNYRISRWVMTPILWMKDEFIFSRLFLHEVIGHAIAKLADAYPRGMDLKARPDGFDRLNTAINREKAIAKWKHIPGFDSNMIVPQKNTHYGTHSPNKHYYVYMGTSRYKRHSRGGDMLMWTIDKYGKYNKENWKNCMSLIEIYYIRKTFYDLSK